MNSSALKEKTEKAIQIYIKDLDNYSLEQLLYKPNPESWSIGQVYIHLWMSAKGFFFKHAEACLKQENTETSKGKNWIGTLVFIFQKMPTIKVKMPTKVAIEPRQPESKEQLIEKLNEIRSLANTYIEQIPNADSKHKTKHPFLGYLNCGEWVSLCAMHFNHHKKQIKRIKSSL